MMRSSAWVVAALVCILAIGQLFAVQIIFDAGVNQLLMPTDTENQRNWLRLTANHISENYLSEVASIRTQYDETLAWLVMWFGSEGAIGGAPPSIPDGINWLHYGLDGSLAGASAGVPNRLRAMHFSEAAAAVWAQPYRRQAQTSRGEHWLLYVDQATLDNALQRAAIDLLSSWQPEAHALLAWLQRDSTSAPIAYRRSIPAATPAVYGYKAPGAEPLALPMARIAKELASMDAGKELFLPDIGSAAMPQPCAIFSLPGSGLTLCVSMRQLEPDILNHPDIARFNSLCITVFLITLLVTALAGAGLLFYQWRTYRQATLDWQRMRADLDTREQLVAASQQKLGTLYGDLRALEAVPPAPGLLTPAALMAWLDANFETFARIPSEDVVGGARASALLLLCLDTPAGHNGGEDTSALLDAISPILRHRMRKNDLVARWNNASFLLILPSISLKVALNRAEYLRATIAGHAFAPREVGEVTVTCGLSLMLSTDTSWRQAIERAKHAASKGRDGQNRVYHEIL
jgi:hypothetical protein